MQEDIYFIDEEQYIVQYGYYRGKSKIAVPKNQKSIIQPNVSNRTKGLTCVPMKMK